LIERTEAGLSRPTSSDSTLGGRESRPHGEGRQLVGISTQNSRMLTGMKFP
jgi:hypothetical protein